MAFVPAGAPDCSVAVFPDVSKFDHVATHVIGHRPDPVAAGKAH